MQRALALLLLSACLASPAFSDDDRSWTNLGQLRPEERIGIIQSDQKRVEGRFAGFSDSGISIRADQVTTVPKANVDPRLPPAACRSRLAHRCRRWHRLGSWSRAQRDRWTTFSQRGSGYRRRLDRRGRRRWGGHRRALRRWQSDHLPPLPSTLAGHRPVPDRLPDHPRRRSKIGTPCEPSHAVRLHHRAQRLPGRPIDR